MGGTISALLKRWRTYTACVHACAFSSSLGFLSGSSVLSSHCPHFSATQDCYRTPTGLSVLKRTACLFQCRALFCLLNSMVKSWTSTLPLIGFETAVFSAIFHEHGPCSKTSSQSVEFSGQEVSGRFACMHFLCGCWPFRTATVPSFDSCYLFVCLDRLFCRQ